MKKSNKNISKKIKPGRRIQTRDDYLESGKKYTKKGYENGAGGNYRPGVTIAGNKNDELAFVKLTTPKKTSIKLDDINSEFRAYVEIRDNEGNPIKPGKKFVVLNKNLSRRDTIKIIKEVRKFEDNRNKLRKLKGRPPK